MPKYMPISFKLVGATLLFLIYTIGCFFIQSVCTSYFYGVTQNSRWKYHVSNRPSNPHLTCHIPFPALQHTSLRKRMFKYNMNKTCGCDQLKKLDLLKGSSVEILKTCGANPTAPSVQVWWWPWVWLVS